MYPNNIAIFWGLLNAQLFTGRKGKKEKERKGNKNQRAHTFFTPVSFPFSLFSREHYSIAGNNNTISFKEKILTKKVLWAVHACYKVLNSF